MSNDSLTRFIRQLRPTLRPGAGSGLSDAELLRRWAKARDEAAFEVLVWRHGPMVAATCRRLLPRPADVEDAFQATFLALVRKAAAIRRHDSVGGWLHRVAYRVALRARARAAQSGPVPEPAAPPDEAHLWRDVRPVIDEEVNRLPEHYRLPFVLCHLDGKTNEEAARELGCPLGTILSRLSTARQRLRGRLARRGITLSAGAVAAGLQAEASAAVPRHLVGAALHCASGGASAAVVVLAEGAIPAAGLYKLQLVLAALLTLGAWTIGVALCGQGAPGSRDKADEAAAGGNTAGALPEAEPGLPKGWSRASDNFAGYQAGLDRRVVKEGKASAYVQMKGSNEGEFGGLAQAVLAAPHRGERLRLTAQLKAAGAAGGAGLWMRIDAKGATLALDNMEGRRLTGDKDWQKAEIVLDVPSEATVVAFGMLLVGDGKAWADDFKLEAVGKDVRPTAGPVQQPHGAGAEAGVPEKPANLGFEEGLAREPKAEPLTKEEAAWLKTAAVPFDTAEPGRGFGDLGKFREVVGGARVVALGEGTHGTREFFQMKHRLTEYLASELGFTHFAIEANLPEARRVNDYVLGGPGDPKELLRGMYFWTWNTQEVLDLIEWMRAFNASGRGKVQFAGFDMQVGTVAMENVRQFVAKVDPEYAKALDRAYAGLADYWADPKTALEARRRTAGEKEAIALRAWGVVRHLEASREAYRAKEKADVVERAIQDARVAAQAAQLQHAAGAYRDECMAENVASILGQAPKGAKVVLWAHNGHVARRTGAMGEALERRFGGEMVVVGFTCHEGTYTAVRRGKGVVSDNVLYPSTAGTVEWNLRQAGHPRCVVDLREAAKAAEGRWLTRPGRLRLVGALAAGEQFRPAVVAREYDALVYFEKTTASRCFGLTRHKG
jgi:erythromycin esterase